MSAPRPNKLTPEIALIAATEVADELVRNGKIEASEVAACAADIARHGRQYMDGYTLAKVLDDCRGWDCDLEIAQTLDGFSSAVREQITAVEKEWAKREGITPPLAIGTRVKIKSGETGEITSIYEYGAAQFLVRIDGDPKAGSPHESRRIVNFENAEALPEPAAA